MKTIFLGLLNRFKEPSSWAAITAALVGVYPAIGDASQSIVLIGAGAAGLLAFFLAEKGKDAN